MPIPPDKEKPPSPHLTLELLASSPQSDALLMVNPDGTIRAVNRPALDLLGCTAAEVVGQPVGKFFADSAALRSTPLPPGVEALGGQRP